LRLKRRHNNYAAYKAFSVKFVIKKKGDDKVKVLIFGMARQWGMATRNN
jgi:hypothetical protein